MKTLQKMIIPVLALGISTCATVPIKENLSDSNEGRFFGIELNIRPKEVAKKSPEKLAQYEETISNFIDFNYNYCTELFYYPGASSKGIDGCYGLLERNRRKLHEALILNPNYPEYLAKKRKATLSRGQTYTGLPPSK